MYKTVYESVCGNISEINRFLWGTGTVLFVFGAGIYITIRIKFFNITHLRHILGSAFSNNEKTENKHAESSISHFQALSTALAASMGTGNIIGVAAAISIGGCGAVFWMWISAIFGMGIGISENVLGGKYLKLEEAQKRKCLKLGVNFPKLEDGPMAYIANGLHFPGLAALYALSCAAASFGIGNMTQSNALSASLSEFGINPLVSGAAAAVVCGWVIFGGGQKVARTTEKIIPAVSLFYIAGAIVIIVIFGKNIAKVLIEIVKSAIGCSQIAGGICGSAISGAVLKKAAASGLRRGVFSNEAGMGSSVLVHTEAGCADPMRMGMWAAAEIVIDTLVCCTATALVILLTGADDSGAEGLAMVTEGFRRGFGRFGAFAPVFTGVSSAVFAVCTLLGWYFYGEKCVRYIFKSGAAVTVYRVLYVIAAFAGAVAELPLVLEAADMLNWFMLAINLTAVLILSGEAAEIVLNYRDSLKGRRSHSEPSDSDGF